MQDEEFKKKLESILENLYKIDREVKDYLEREKVGVGTIGCDKKSYLKNGQIAHEEKYGSK